MAINAKQRRLYLRTWLEVRAVLVNLAGMTAKEADAERHAIHAEALGRDKSSKAFNNADLDRVLDAFKKRLIVADHTRPARAITGERDRLLHGIRAKGFSDEVIRGVCRRSAHAFAHREDWEQFDTELLRTLVIQLEQWKREQRTAAGVQEPF